MMQIQQVIVTGRNHDHPETYSGVVLEWHGKAG
jgi:hypothetical protein